MKKRILSIVLILMLIHGCAPISNGEPDTIPNETQSEETETKQPTPQETGTPNEADEEDTGPLLPVVTPFLTLEEFPAMDGSTANLPLMAAVMACSTGIPYNEAVNMVSCTTTPNSYINLIMGNADILLVYEAAEYTKKEIEASNTPLSFLPIGRDALVFIGNEANNVKSLTLDELKKIYTGKITNWKELNGDDKNIVAFQREETSGSQALFIKLLMKDIAPMEAPRSYYPDDMAGLIDLVADYNDDGGAIGYSVYYYANYMYTHPGLMFFDVEGITPGDETIASGKYPLVNEFFAVIREDEPANSPARRLFEWLNTDEGKTVIAGAGYIPYK